MGVRVGTAALLAWGLSGCAAAAGDGRGGGVATGARTRADCHPANEISAEPLVAPGILNPGRVEDDYPVVAAREIAPCVLSGTLAIETPLFSDERAPRPFARAEFLQVESVGLAAEGARQELRLSWPLRARVWVSADAFPFALSERTDLVADRYWLARGARVAAWKGTRPGTVVITRPLEAGFEVPGFDGGAIRLERPCSSLALPIEGMFDRALGPSHAMVAAGLERWVDVAAGTELRAAPNGRALGTLPAMTSLGVLEERGSWVLVREYTQTLTRGVDFQGWVRRTDTSAGLKPAIAFGPMWLAATHRSVVEVPVHAAPEAPALVGVIPPGVPFRAVQHVQGHVEVHLPGIARGGTWVAEADLCTAERLR